MHDSIILLEFYERYPQVDQEAKRDYWIQRDLFKGEVIWR